VFLKQVERALKDRRLLLMFDEAMCLRDAVRAGKLESDIFSLSEPPASTLPAANFVFCVGGRPREIDPEFAQAFRAALYKEISFLGREAAVKLIIRPVERWFGYSQSAIDEIYRITQDTPTSSS